MATFKHGGMIIPAGSPQHDPKMIKKLSRSGAMAVRRAVVSARDLIGD
jgi:hypothetical protein